MKSSIISKIIISNLFVLIFAIVTLGIFYNYIRHDAENILKNRKYISKISTSVNKVVSNLYQAAILKENLHLARASNASLEVINAIEDLEKSGFYTHEIRQQYLEFYKNTVITTSMLIENRREDARIADKISSQKYENLHFMLKEIILKIDEKQNDLTKNMIALIFISGVILTLLILANIIYLIRSYRSFEAKQHELLNAQEQRATMLDSLGDGVYGVDKQGVCTFINASGANMLEFAVDEIVGTHQHHLFHHHKPDNSEYPQEECPIHHTVEDGQKRVVNEYFITKTGRFVPVALTVAPFGDGGAVVVFKDITDAKKYEEELERRVLEKTAQLHELNENLEQKVIFEINKNRKQEEFMQQQSRLAALGEMIGNIAHQWRQPLSAITTAISGLKVKQEFGMEVTPEDIIETSDMVIRSANYLSQTIDDFRNFVKHDKTKAIFEVSLVVHKVLDIVGVVLRSNNIEVVLDTDDEVQCDGYANELTQVLINIINNSKDAYVENNSEIRHLKVSVKDESYTAVIRISDIAGGIPDVIKDKIFDPYFTTKHQSQGTGLGLYMSANIIRDHFKGKLYILDNHEIIDDKDYKGTTFVIELPR